MTALSYPPSQAPAHAPTMMDAREEVRMTEEYDGETYGYSPGVLKVLFEFAGTTDIDEALRIVRERQKIGMERMKDHAEELALLADPEFRAAARR